MATAEGRIAERPPLGSRQRAENNALLQEIANFCRAVGMAESTFGRHAVNDGKFVARLRFGGRVTTSTADRVRAFIARHVPDTSTPAPRNGWWRNASSWSWR